MTAAAGVSRTAGFWGFRGFLAVLATYTVLHLVLALSLDRAAGVDDVAEAIFAQTLEWGYYPRQPPGYTWLQWASFQLFGVTPLAQAVLRYALVAAGYLFFYLGARRVVADPRLALLAGLSPSLIYAIGWGVHMGFTNTLLLTAACAATFYTFVRILQGGGSGSYAALGAALGAGVLSKYGFPLFALSLFAAALIQPGARRRLLDRRMLVTLAVLCLVAAPYFVWGFEGAGSFEAVFTKTMKEGGKAPYLTGVASGLTELLEAIVAFLAPLWLLLLFVFPQAVWPTARFGGGSAAVAAPAAPVARPEDWNARRLLEHFFIIVLVVLVLSVFVAGVTYFKSRWMHPALLLFPVYYFIRVEKAGFAERPIGRYARILLAFAVLVVAFRVARAVIGPPLCSSCRLSMPYPELAQAIAARGFEGGTIVAEEEHIAGNFRMRFPGSRVISVSYPFYAPPLERSAEPGQCLVVWHARDGEEAVPAKVAEFARERLDLDLAARRPTGRVAAEPHFRDGRVIRLDYWLGPGTGRCR